MSSIFILVSTIATLFILVYAALQAWLVTQFLSGYTSVPPPSSSESESWPSVLVQLPVYNEGPVVNDLLAAAACLDYPRNCLTIQLLDDSTDDTSAIAAAMIEKLRQRTGIEILHVRRASRAGFKAGALAEGMASDVRRSDFIAIFDSDFAPRPDFLRRVIPFFQSPRLGLVQTRWSHQNAASSIFTRLMSLALDNHFAVEQGGRSAAGCFINFNGTAGVWRRTAIEDAGGWSADSLTEDLDLSFRAQMAGWQCRYEISIDTPSELPAQLSALRAQQFRWTKGTIEAACKLVGPLLRAPIPLRQKIVGTLHLVSGAQFLAVLAFGLAALGLHFAGTVPHLGLYRFLSVLMTIATASVAMSFTVSQHALGMRQPQALLATTARTLLFTAFAAGFSVQNSWATLEALAARKTEFVRTPKRGMAAARRIPGTLLVEAALAVAFIDAAIDELLAWHAQVIPLFGILAVYGGSFAVMAIFTLSEKVPLSPLWPLGKVARDIAD